MNVAFNVDCMEGMKQFPDKYFDLAVVDPPYGDALANESGGGGIGTGSVNGSTGTNRPFAQLPATRREREREARTTRTGPERQTTGRNVGLCELAERGRRSTQKNHLVGRRAGAGVFRGTVSRLTKPNHLGGQLFSSPSDKVLFGMAQADNFRGVHNGYG